MLLYPFYTGYDQMMENYTLGLQGKSIMNRCVFELCGTYLKHPESEPPTLVDLHRILLEQPDTQANFVRNPGTGLRTYQGGGALVPFVNRFQTDTALYRLMTTKLFKISDNLVY